MVRGSYTHESHSTSLCYTELNEANLTYNFFIRLS